MNQSHRRSAAGDAAGHSDAASGADEDTSLEPALDIALDTDSSEGSEPAELATETDGAAASLRTTEREHLALSRQVKLERRAPLPTVSEFAGYDNVLPGAADRILTMTEERAAHHRWVQVRRMDALDGTTKLIVILGSVVVLAVVGSVLAIALTLILQGHPLPGAVVGIADIAGVVAALWRLARQRGSRRGPRHQRPPEPEDQDT